MAIFDQIEECPYLCEECDHYLKGLSCKAFDRIPEKIYQNPENHKSVVPGQKGDYVFATKQPRRQIRTYFDDAAPED